jgi:hypothetical protein
MATGLFSREDAADADELEVPTLDVTVEIPGQPQQAQHDAQRDRIVLDRTLFSSVPPTTGSSRTPRPDGDRSRSSLARSPPRACSRRRSHGTSGDPWRPFGLDPTVPMVL